MVSFLPLAIAFLILMYGILTEICKRNSVAQYYIKTFFLFWWYMGTAALVIPIALFRPGDTINMWWWSFWVKVGLTQWWFDMDIKKQNTEELEYEGPCIIVCNHQTALDQIAVLYVWPSTRTTFMAKKSIKYAGTTGLACNLAGNIWVDRGNKEKAKSQTTKECLEYVTEKKGKLFIYPEGTRTQNREEHMLPFKKGAFHIAVQAQVPIIPVVMSAYKNMYNDNTKTFEKVDITIKVLPKISTKGMTEDDVTTLTNQVRSKMLETYYDISPHMEKLTAQETDDTVETHVPETQSPETQSPEIQSPEAQRLGTQNPETLVPNTEDDTNENDNNSVKGESVQTKTDESDAKKRTDTVPNLEQKAKDLRPPDVSSDEPNKSICEPSEGGNSQKDENKDGSLAQSSVDSSLSQNKEMESSTFSNLSESTLLVDFSEPQPKDIVNDETTCKTKSGENDESPSSQASSDSFVFVNSSKLDEETNLESKEESSLENIGEGEVGAQEMSSREESEPESLQRVEDVLDNTSEETKADSHVDSERLENPTPSTAE